jgi:hypothetical protein
MEIVISERINNIDANKGISEIKKIIMDFALGIKVKLNEITVSHNGWFAVNFSGEDSEILIEIIKRKFGIAPTKYAQIKIGDVYKGFISEIDKEFINLDIGLLSQDNYKLTYSLDTLKSQLTNGFDLSMKDIVSKFLFYRDLPLELRVEGIERNGKIKFEMSDFQVNYLKDLTINPLERIIIVGTLSKEIIKTIRKIMAYRDIVKIDSLSITNHMLVCKLGTNALGLIRKISPYLKEAKIYSFGLN